MIDQANQGESENTLFDQQNAAQYSFKQLALYSVDAFDACLTMHVCCSPNPVNLADLDIWSQVMAKVMGKCGPPLTVFVG